MNHILQMSISVDIFISSSWPMGISNLGNSPDDPALLEAGNIDVARSSRELKPRLALKYRKMFLTCLGIIFLDLNASIMSVDRTKIILNCPKLLDLLRWQMLEIRIKKNIFMHLILIQTKVFQKYLMTSHNALFPKKKMKKSKKNKVTEG